MSHATLCRALLAIALCIGLRLDAADWPPTEQALMAEIQKHFADGKKLSDQIDWGMEHSHCIGTLFHKACCAGHVSAVKFLLDKGAKIEDDSFDVKGNFGVHLPLALAARFGHTNVVKLLVERGADVKARGLNGSGPLWAAAWRGD